jgi:hypothetical protein
VAVGVGVGVQVAVGVAVGVGVEVAVGVAVGVRVGVEVAVGERVGVGEAVGLGTIAATALPTRPEIWPWKRQKTTPTNSTASGSAASISQRIRSDRDPRCTPFISPISWGSRYLKYPLLSSRSPVQSPIREKEPAKGFEGERFDTQQVPWYNLCRAGE